MSVAPRRPKGPPLNAMRAFEAAARHVSFVAAADELNVTPGAISQHIKTLEAWAETPLFRRNAQGVALTRAGQSLVTAFTDAFDNLAHATRALRNLNPNQGFHIATLPSIAQLWLPKRLARARAQFPQISFSVTALETPPSLSREMFDVAIFIGAPQGAEDEVIICDDQIMPVCAPSVMAQFKDTGFADIPLLHDQTWADDWLSWSKTAGVDLPDPQDGPRFSLYSLAVEEAKAGAGALMGHTCLVEDLIASHTLATMGHGPVSTGKALILKMPASGERRPETDQIVKLLA